MSRNFTWFHTHLLLRPVVILRPFIYFSSINIARLRHSFKVKPSFSYGGGRAGKEFGNAKTFLFFFQPFPRQRFLKRSTFRPDFFFTTRTELKKGCNVPEIVRIGKEPEEPEEAAVADEAVGVAGRERFWQRSIRRSIQRRALVHLPSTDGSTCGAARKEKRSIGRATCTPAARWFPGLTKKKVGSQWGGHDPPRRSFPVAAGVVKRQ